MVSKERVSQLLGMLKLKLTNWTGLDIAILW